MKYHLAVLCLLLTWSFSFTQSNFWNSPSAQINSENLKLLSAPHQEYYTLEESELRKEINQVDDSSEEETVIYLPLPDGQVEMFMISYSPVMATGLRKKFPNIKSYRIYAINERSLQGCLTISHKGLRAYLLDGENDIYINPIQIGTERYYQSIYEREYVLKSNESNDYSCENHPDHLDENKQDQFLKESRDVDLL